MHEYLLGFSTYCICTAVFYGQLLVHNWKMRTIKNKTLLMFTMVFNALLISKKKILSECSVAAHLFYYYSYFRKNFNNYCIKQDYLKYNDSTILVSCLVINSIVIKPAIGSQIKLFIHIRH